MNYVTEQGFFLDGQGRAYMQGGGKFQDAGEYNPDIHGLPVPLASKCRSILTSQCIMVMKYGRCYNSTGL